MAKYVVSGGRRVAGFAPGDVVDMDDLQGVDVAHLVSAGHLAPHKPAKAVKADVESQPEPAIEKEEN